MVNLSRRGFIAASLAAGAVRVLPGALTKTPARHVVTLVYDKGLGMMRIIDRLVP